MNSTIKKRLEVMEEKLKASGPTYVLVELSDGTEQEMEIHEFHERWHEVRRFIKFTRGFDPKYRDIDVLMSVWEECAMEGQGINSDE